MTETAPRTISLPLGVVLRRTPGATRWVKHAWTPVAVLPGAPDAHWKLMRQEGDAVEFHAATLPLILHRADVEAYKVSLSMTPPAVFVVLRASDDPADPHDITVHAVTASAYEAQDYLDSGEEIVEPVPMPDGLIAWIGDFARAHFEETPFIKRRRDKKRIDETEDGIGDARIRQTADVYRAPGATKPAKGTP